jgi:GTP diphosphokinase / guanosine-3',5'-bis(diphosphate) 3'-diphosphatase
MSRLVSGTPDEDVTEVPLARPVKIGKPDISKGVVVKGLEDVWVKLGRCCTPVPGDAIVGFVSRGQGVSVHRDTCPNLRTLQRREPERIIEVDWAEGKPTSFSVAIQVEALDRTRLLSDVATVLSDSHVNILAATSSTGRDRITRLRFTFEMADVAHLSSLLAAVKRVESVYDAYRVVPS